MSESGQSISCGACGSINRGAAKFCGECGTSLIVQAACASCGSQLDPRQRFCDECGTPVPGREGRTTGSTLSPNVVARNRATTRRTYGGGRYEVVRFLGEGGRKRVFLANDTQLARDVAVSAFKSEGVDETALERARREAEAMARLGDHPNIVTIYDIGEEDGELFLVSQYMSGGDLSGLLTQAENGRLAVQEIVRISGEVVRALEYAHKQGVIHRDIKPQNIWLAPDGTAKLGDFGLAMAADRSRMTVEGAMIGTVAYMPPEQGLGRSADARSDLYSLGAVMYELLSGAPPFVGEDAAAVISQHVSTAPVAPSWHRSDVPRALERVVLKLLAKTADDRFQNATEVREALDAIDSASAAAGTPKQEGASALDRLTDGVFLGREKETKDLRLAVDEAVAGRGRVVMIAGEAGIGKTRLAVEIETYAELRGAQVIWGRCYKDEGAPAYWPWVQAIRAYVRSRNPEELVPELGSGASDIAQVVSDVRSRLPDLPEPLPLDPEQTRFRLFDSVTTFLRNASSARPLAIFLEDIHLADKPSLLLFEFLARELKTARILVLATHRDAEGEENQELQRLLATLSHERNFQRLLLGGLDQKEVKALLQEVSRQTLETPAELILLETIFENSGGNPYFIEEIIRHLLESGAIYRRDDKWVSDAQHISELGIPRGIREVIDRRLSRLGSQCRELLSVAAAIGNEFGLQTIERVTDMETATVVDRVQEAVDAGILSAVPDERNLYRFSHAATRDTIYDELPAARRVELHQSIGEALEELYDDRIESHLSELANHFSQAASAGLAEKAADYSWWAGERAAALAAYEEAVTHYSTAIQLFDTSTEEPTRRCELLLVLGDALGRTGAVAKAKETFLEAAEIAERLSLRDQYARAALGFGGGAGGGLTALDRADERLVELLRAALYGLSERDSLLRVRVLARLAVELRLTDDPSETEALSRAAVEMAERLGDARIMLLAMYSREWATMGPDTVDDALAASDEIIRLARIVGDREMDFHGHHLRLHTYLQLGDIRAVDREIRTCEKLANELRQPNYEWQATVFRTMRALMQGRFEEGERLAGAAFAIGQRTEPEVAAVVLGVHTFLTMWATGTMGDLEQGGEDFAARYPNSAWPAALTWLLSEAELKPKARAAFEPLARTAFQGIRRDANWLTAMTCVSLAASYLEDAQGAATLYEMFSPYADRCTSILGGAACVGSNHMFLGFLAETMGRLDQAIVHFQRALDVNEQIGAYFILPRTYFGFARTLLARGNTGDAELASKLIETGLDRARAMSLPKEVERLLSLKLERDGLAGIDVKTSIYAVASSVDRTRPDLTGAAAPDGTVTIMFSDIEDSTVLTERLGDRQWLQLLERHNQIVRSHLAEHGGYEVKSQGDGFMLAFASARNATHCAIDVQRALADHRREHPNEPLSVRIGLHTGEALRSEDDFFGKNVVLAARIAAQAKGGQILVSALLRELVLSTGEFEFGDERELELKGLSGVYRVFEVPWATVPAAESL